MRAIRFDKGIESLINTKVTHMDHGNNPIFRDKAGWLVQSIDWFDYN